jgi:hypothetical protein
VSSQPASGCGRRRAAGARHRGLPYETRCPLAPFSGSGGEPLAVRARAQGVEVVTLDGGVDGVAGGNSNSFSPELARVGFGVAIKGRTADFGCGESHGL